MEELENKWVKKTKDKEKKGMRALERKVSTEMKELYGKTKKRQVEIYITLLRKFQVDTERIKKL
jgi:glutamyl-tRNA reductase